MTEDELFAAYGDGIALDESIPTASEFTFPIDPEIEFNPDEPVLIAFRVAVVRGEA